jgi:uncharacterized ferredoxin-like protein
MTKEFRIHLFDVAGATSPQQFIDLLGKLATIPDDSAFVCVDYRLAFSENLVCVAIRSDSFVDSDVVLVPRLLDRRLGQR